MMNAALTRREFVMGVCAGTAALGLGQPLAAAADNPAGMKPNIIFILADDLGYGDLGCYEQQKILTPSVDNLAREGMRFTQVYAGSPVCAPSRCSLMTGLHNGHNRIRDNIPYGTWLQDEDLTIAEALKPAGYRTGCVGKWALGIHGSQGKPNDQGFDDWFGFLDQRLAQNYYPYDLWENDTIHLLQGNWGERKQQYVQDVFSDRACKFITQSRGGPFFLYLAYIAPHNSDYPSNTPESYIVPTDEPYTDRDWPQVEKNYAAMITRMDRDVGRIMALLKHLGIDDNTIVFFTSDNGADGNPKHLHRPEFFGSYGPLRGAKRGMYEGGIRVPMVARWPGRVPAGRISDEPWAFWDVMPTLVEMAGVTPPPDIDGISVLPTLRGQVQKHKHEYFYWDYGHTRGNYRQAVRLGDWKGVRNGPGAEIELYDLASDAAETRDVASLHPETISRIAQVVKEAYVPSPAYPLRVPETGEGG